MKNGDKGRVYRIKRKLYSKVFRMITIVSPYWNTQIRFLRATGHLADLKNPRTFSEKISWLKLYRYANDPLVKQCADKLSVREYVREKGFEKMLIPICAVFQDPESILWETLPDSFVLKWNFGCGFNLLCSDKVAFNMEEGIRQLKKWKNNRYWLEYAELQYKVKERRIICEKYLKVGSGEELLDYKFYCFHGKVLAILVIERPEDDEKAAVMLSPEWEILSNVSGRYKRTLVVDKPRSFDEMKRAAELLSEPFPFVRIDFYDCDGKPFFGEMTFTPAAGILPAEAEINGKIMGDYIDIRGKQ